MKYYSGLDNIRIEKDIMKGLLDGKPNRFVVETLKKNWQKLPYKAAMKRVIKVRKEFNDMKVEGLAKTISLHIDRYEKLYQICLGRSYSLLGMRCMFLKEKLVGMEHTEDESKFNVQINNKIIHIEGGSHNFGSLSSEEMGRLSFFMNKLGIKGDEFRQIRA